jgi:TolB-like protein
MSLWAELSRRNVIRVTGLYVVGAWLALQVAETVLPIVEAPGWMLKLLLAALAVGVIPAALLAWVFELTPQGLRRESELDRSQAGTGPSARRLDIAVIVLLLLTIGTTLALRPGSTVVDPKPAPVAADAAQPSAPLQAPAAAPAALALGIGVLPFDNLSEEAANAFFAGGVHEEVLTHLSRIAGLRVISRTSMLKIGEENLDITAIGQRLGVSHVLEGSVRRANDRVRVTVQLIDAATDEHVWAENYDRTLDDVFAIQSEIALAIAERLHIELSPRLVDRIRERPTDNQQAYDLYLRAIGLSGNWRGAEGFIEIVDLLEQALQLDPAMLAAMTMLVKAHGRLAWLDADADGLHEARARELLTRVREGWPQRPEAGLALAHYLYTVERDYGRALVEYRSVQPSMPNDSEVLGGISNSLKRLDRNEEWIVAARQVVEIDPASPLAHTELANALQSVGRREEALAIAKATSARAPDCAWCRTMEASLQLDLHGDVEPLLALASDQRAVQSLDPENVYSAATILAGRGDMKQALAVLEQLRTTAKDMSQVQLDVHAAMLLRAAGRGEEAASYASRAYQGASDELGATRVRSREFVAFSYARAATAAALVGEREAVRTWGQRATSEPLAGSSTLYRDYLLAYAYALDGDPSGGWALFSPATADQLSARFVLSQRFLLDNLFGTVPAYQARMIELQTEL